MSTSDKIWGICVFIVSIVLASKGAAMAYSVMMMLAVWLVSAIGAGAILGTIIAAFFAVFAALFAAITAVFVYAGVAFFAQVLRAGFNNLFRDGDKTTISEMAV